MTLLPKSICPSCGEELDAASHIEKKDQKPKPGDITICLFCGELMIFAGDLSLRNLNDAEMHEVAGDPRILAIQRARKKVQL